MRCNKVLLALLPLIFMTAMPAAAQPYAYLGTDGADTFSVTGGTLQSLDLATHGVGGYLEGFGAILGLVARPDGAFVYAIDSRSNLLVMKTYNGALGVTATVALPNAPGHIAITPDGQFLYISESTAPELTVVSTLTNAVVATVPLKAIPKSLAISPNGSFLYVTEANAFEIKVVSTATNKVVNTIPLNIPSTGVQMYSSLSLTPDGNFLYAADQGNFSVAVISTAANRVFTDITLPFQPGGSGVSPDGKYLYLSDPSSGNVALISTGSNRVSRTIRLDYGPNIVNTDIAFTSDGKFAYVVKGQEIIVIDTVNKIEVEAIGSDFGNDTSIAIANAPPVPGPAFTATRSGIEFGLRPVGTTSVTVPVRVDNIGQFPLTYSFAFSGAAPLDFQSGNSCPSPLQVGQQCTLEVVFAPTASGVRTANLTVTGAGTNKGVPYSTKQDISLEGPAIDALPAGPLAFSPTVVMYEPHPVFESSGVTTILASNVSGSPVTIASVSAEGLNPQDFTIISNPCVGVLIPGQSCAIHLVFTPKALGKVTATINYTIKGQVQAQEVLVYGTGT